MQDLLLFSHYHLYSLSRKPCPFTEKGSGHAAIRTQLSNTAVDNKMLTSAKHVTCYYSMTNGIYEEHGSDWSHQVFAWWQLDGCSMTRPFICTATKGVACKTTLLTKNCSVIHTYRTKENYYIICALISHSSDRVVTQIMFPLVHNSPAIVVVPSYIQPVSFQEADSTEDTIPQQHFCCCSLSEWNFLCLASESDRRCRTEMVCLAKLTAERVSVETETVHQMLRSLKKRPGGSLVHR